MIAGAKRKIDGGITIEVMSTGKPLKVGEFVLSILGLIVCFVLAPKFLSRGTCEDNEKEFRVKEYQFKIAYKKYEQEYRYTVLSGTSFSGDKEVGLGTLYDNVAIGDSLVKQKGSTDVVTIHDRRRIVHDCSCRKKD